MIRSSRRLFIPGFTIVELLIVITVIGILAALVIVSYNGVQQAAREKTLISDAEGVAAEVTRYSVKNNGTLGGAVSWYSEGATNSNVHFTPSPGNIIDVVANTTDYCIRVYNVGTNKNSITTAETKESSPGVCTTLSPSIAAGGTLSCPAGFIPVPGNSLLSTSDFCAMKYEAKNVGGVATSQASGVPWGYITQTNATALASNACSGCHLLTENERVTIAHNILAQGSNWTGGSVGSGSLFIGANDSSPTSPQAASSTDSDGYINTGNSSSSGANQQRTFTLSNGEVIWDFAGNAWEWTSGTITGNQPGVGANAYRQWNAISNMGGLAAFIQPSYGNASAAAWTTAQGLGGIYSSDANLTTSAMYWGGATNQYSGTNGGIFNLALDQGPLTTSTVIGFRVAK